jgi:methionine synthase I (cobalamin-dependent)
VAFTNTFGANRPRLRRFGLETRLGEVIRAAVRLAREGSPGCQVVGSLGPTGETLPLGGKPEEARFVEEAFAESASHLADAGVDALIIETMFHPLELGAALRGCRKGAPNAYLVAAITLMPGASGLETPHGVPVDKMIRALESCPPDAAGVNCSIEGERMLAAVEYLQERLALPLWAKPQGKIPPKCVTPRTTETPEVFARNAMRLVAAGVSAIGGCCGTGPAEIAALKSAIERSRSKVAS